MTFPFPIPPLTELTWQDLVRHLALQPADAVAGLARHSDHCLIARFLTARYPDYCFTVAPSRLRCAHRGSAFSRTPWRPAETVSLTSWQREIVSRFDNLRGVELGISMREPVRVAEALTLLADIFGAEAVLEVVEETRGAARDDRAREAPVAAKELIAV